MTNTIAICIAALIAGFFLLDAYVLGWDTHILLMRGLVELIDRMAFWR